GSGSIAYVPQDAQEDDQLQFALKLLRGEEQHAAFPPDPAKALPN
ncbi:MAG: peptidase S41, partial [Pseudomonadota bacterium]